MYEKTGLGVWSIEDYTWELQDTTCETIDFRNITHKAITLWSRLRSLGHSQRKGRHHLSNMPHARSAILQLLWIHLSGRSSRNVIGTPAQIHIVQTFRHLIRPGLHPFEEHLKPIDVPSRMVSPCMEALYSDKYIPLFHPSITCQHPL